MAPSRSSTSDPAATISLYVNDPGRKIPALCAASPFLPAPPLPFLSSHGSPPSVLPEAASDDPPLVPAAFRSNNSRRLPSAIVGSSSQAATPGRETLTVGASDLVKPIRMTLGSFSAASLAAADAWEVREEPADDLTKPFHKLQLLPRSIIVRPDGPCLGRLSDDPLIPN